MITADSFLSSLQDLITTHFDRSELADVCLRLGVNFDNLPTASLKAQVRELILALARQERLPELLDVLRIERPLVSWPSFPSGFKAPEIVADSPPAGSNSFHIGSINAGNVIIGNNAQMTVNSGSHDEHSQDNQEALIKIQSILRDVRQSIKALSAIDNALRIELLMLIGQLDMVLQQTRPGEEEAATALAEITRSLVEAASTAKPSKPTIRALGEGLKTTATELNEELPAVLDTAYKIIAAVDVVVGI